LTREVGGAPTRYPSLIRTPIEDGSHIIFDGSDFDQFKDDVKKVERQKMERLLYVALTRAKHTLVLAFDRQFFLNKRRQFQANSQIRWLRAADDECNCEVVAALSTEARECIQTRDRQKSAPREQVCENLGSRHLGWIDDARRCAARFVHAINPSKFVPDEVEPGESTDVWMEVEPELRPARIDSLATRYGLWWHGFMQRVPWSVGVDAWQTVFDETIGTSPEPARSKREWKMLRGRISLVSDFPTRFTNDAAVVHTEMPFFWRLDERGCLEGIIDLALREAAEEKWFILDWKTNRIVPEAIDKLRALYRPQIAAYWKAVAEMTKQPVSAAIYSTATGQFIAYDPDELAREWERLRSLTQDELAGEIKKD